MIRSPVRILKARKSFAPVAMKLPEWEIAVALTYNLWAKKIKNSECYLPIKSPRLQKWRNEEAQMTVYSKQRLFLALKLLQLWYHHWKILRPPPWLQKKDCFFIILVLYLYLWFIAVKYFLKFACLYVPQMKVCYQIPTIWRHSTHLHLSSS